MALRATPTTTYHPPIRHRGSRQLGLEGQAVGVFAVAIALGAAALTFASSMLGAALLLGLAALLGRRALTVVARDGETEPVLRPTDQAGLDATLAVALGVTALILASNGDPGAGVAAAIGACAVSGLLITTRYLTR